MNISLALNVRGLMNVKSEVNHTVRISPFIVIPGNNFVEILVKRKSCNLVVY